MSLCWTPSIFSNRAMMTSSRSLRLGKACTMYHGTFSAKQFKIFLLSPDYILRIGNVTVYYTNEFKYLLKEAKAKVGSILDLVVEKFCSCLYVLSSALYYHAPAIFSLGCCYYSILTYFIGKH